MSHILIYTDSHGIYGVEHCNRELVRALQDAGYQVTLVQAYSDHQKIDSNDKSSPNPMDVDGGRSALLLAPAIQADPMHLLNQHDPDLIMFSDTSPFANMSAKQAAITLGIPFFISAHGGNPKWATVYPEWMTKLPEIFRTAQTVIGSSQVTLDLLNGMFRLPFDRGAVIYNGLPPESFEPKNLSRREKIRGELNIPSDAIVCLTIASLAKQGGIDHLIAAAVELRQRPSAKNLHFLWMGIGANHGYIDARLKEHDLQERVHILPPQQNSEALFDCADIYVASTEFEGLSLKIMQAMAKGLPVIAASVGDLPELIDEAGFLLPDPVWGPLDRVLAKTILWMTESEQLRFEVGQTGKRRAVQFYQEESMVNSYLTIIGALLSRLGAHAAVANRVGGEPVVSPPPLNL